MAQSTMSVPNSIIGYTGCFLFYWVKAEGARNFGPAPQGILSSYVNSSIKNHNIVVGSGDLIPVQGHGSTILPYLYP